MRADLAPLVWIDVHQNMPQPQAVSLPHIKAEGGERESALDDVAGLRGTSLAITPFRQKNIAGLFRGQSQPDVRVCEHGACSFGVVTPRPRGLPDRLEVEHPGIVPPRRVRRRVTSEVVHRIRGRHRVVIDHLGGGVQVRCVPAQRANRRGVLVAIPVAVTNAVLAGVGPVNLNGPLREVPVRQVAIDLRRRLSVDGKGLHLPGMGLHGRFTSPRCDAMTNDEEGSQPVCVAGNGHWVCSYTSAGIATNV